MKKWCVFFELKTEFLNIIYMKAGIKQFIGVSSNNLFRSTKLLSLACRLYVCVIIYLLIIIHVLQIPSYYWSWRNVHILKPH
jgi:hypothetical protein